MSTETIERACPQSAVAFPGKYLRLVSYRRDGTPVATPMWFVADGDRLLALTDAQSGKVKRIRRRPEVTIAPCRWDGRVIGDEMHARAEVLPENELPRTQRLIDRKYRFDRFFILPLYNLVERIGGRRRSGEIAVLAITPR